MDAKASNELYQIKKELQSIINELNDIAYGVQRNFSGIGNEKCSKSIYAAASHYSSVKKKLDNMDTTKVREDFAPAYSSGGGRHG